MGNIETAILSDYLFVAEQAFGESYSKDFSFVKPSCGIVITNNEGENINIKLKILNTAKDAFPKIPRIFFREKKPYLTYKERTELEKQLEKEGIIAFVYERVGRNSTFPEVVMTIKNGYDLLKSLYHESFHDFTERIGGPSIEMVYKFDFEECIAEFFGELCADNHIKRIKDQQLYKRLRKDRGEAIENEERLTALIEKAQSLLKNGQVEEAKKYVEKESEAMVKEGVRDRKLNLAAISLFADYKQSLEIQKKLRLFYKMSCSTQFFATWTGFMKSTEDLNYCLKEKEYLKNLKPEEIKKELENLLEKAKPNYEHIKRTYKGRWIKKLENFRKDYLNILTRVDELLGQGVNISDLIIKNKKRGNKFCAPFQLDRIIEDEGVDPKSMANILHKTYTNLRKEKLRFLK